MGALFISCYSKNIEDGYVLVSQGLWTGFLLVLQVVGGCLCMGVGVHHRVMG